MLRRDPAWSFRRLTVSSAKLNSSTDSCGRRGVFREGSIGIDRLGVAGMADLRGVGGPIGLGPSDSRRRGSGVGSPVARLPEPAPPSLIRLRPKLSALSVLRQRVVDNPVRFGGGSGTPCELASLQHRAITIAARRTELPRTTGSAIGGSGGSSRSGSFADAARRARSRDRGTRGGSTRSAAPRMDSATSLRP